LARRFGENIVTSLSGGWIDANWCNSANIITFGIKLLWKLSILLGRAHGIRDCYISFYRRCKASRLCFCESHEYRDKHYNNEANESRNNFKIGLSFLAWFSSKGMNILPMQILSKSFIEIIEQNTPYQALLVRSTLVDSPRKITERIKSIVAITIEHKLWFNSKLSSTYPSIAMPYA
jgi:hypothetical protein